MLFPVLRNLPFRPAFVSLSLVLAQSLAPAAQAESTSFTQSLAASASSEAAIADWYRSTGYDTLWTGADDAARRAALLAALSTAKDHGLPVARYDVAALVRELRAAETEGDRGRVEVAMTRAYLAWAHDLTSGALVPKEVDAGIVREINVIEPQVLLSRIAKGDPEAVLAWLEPKSVQYLQLMKAKLGLE
ncbi:MAG: murein L,D-transpeptidase, partial [Tabrizicola sp.]